MNLSDCQLTVIGHTHGASTFAKCVLPYFLHCIASEDDTFVCNTGKVYCIPKTFFLPRLSSLHACLLCFDNWGVVAILIVAKFRETPHTQIGSHG